MLPLVAVAAEEVVTVVVGVVVGMAAAAEGLAGAAGATGLLHVSAVRNKRRHKG